MFAGAGINSSTFLTGLVVFCSVYFEGRPGEYTEQKERRVSTGKGWCSSAPHLAQKLCLECKDKVSKKAYITLVTGNRHRRMETESQAYT